jgi:hypothetical protein
MTLTNFKNALTEEELSIVSNEMLGNKFPWYHQERAISVDKKYSTTQYPFVCHNLMIRSHSKGKEPGIIYSNYFNFFHEIFKRNCPTHNFLLRMSLNLTFFHPEKHGDIHVDHDFEHNNMIIYLNSFSNGKTYLFDNNNEIVDEILPALNSGCIFPGNLHAQGFCNPGESRLILIATYN